MVYPANDKFELEHFRDADLTFLDELGRLDGEGHSFEKLLEQFFISKIQCGREPAKQAEMIKFRDAAVAQWIVREGCVMVLKTTDPIQPTRQWRTDQQPRFVRCLTFPETIEKDETAMSKWKQSLKKVCQLMNVIYLAPKRQSKRKRPFESERVSATVPMKVVGRKPMQVGHPSWTHEAHEGSRKEPMKVLAKESMKVLDGSARFITVSFDGR